MDLLSGNEAIARGAWEAGCHIGVAYPGTPSTETMESFAKLPDVYAEWSPNEKVAVEVGAGASAAGARVLATMKHVGVNVAADPLFTLAYTGVNGGMLVMTADDPGMHSSQNEQDNHYYAHAAHIPMLEPSDSQEAHDMAKEAFDLSERFDLPLFIRTTVRTSHAKTPVEVGDRTTVDIKPYEKDPSKWVMMPAFSIPRRASLDERVDAVCEWVEQTPLNRIVAGNGTDDGDIGIICAGAVYQYVRDAMPEARVLKLGVTWPLPRRKIENFVSGVKHAYVVEECSTYLSAQIRALGIAIDDVPNPLPRDGELTPEIVQSAFGKPVPNHVDATDDLPGRPPALCAGCPHRVVFRELARLHAIVVGDIGCYTLGALPPLSAMDTTLCMGASVSMGHGFELAMRHTGHRPIVSVIGDSTFGHSGLESLLGTVYNAGTGTVCILDNRTTAMTGQQGDMFNGITLQHRPTRELDIESIVRSLGIDYVEVIDPNDVHATRNALRRATKADDKLSVLIFRAPCARLKDFESKPPLHVDEEACTGCGVCVSIGCPALSFDLDRGVSHIDASQCVGCKQCQQYCAFHAIKED